MIRPSSSTTARNGNGQSPRTLPPMHPIVKGAGMTQGLTFINRNIVAPAQAGAHYVCPSRTTGEIGTSLRWCDALILFEVLA